MITLNAVLLTACGSGVRVQKSAVQYFDKGFSATVANKSFKVKGRRFGDPTFLDLFEIRDVKTDSIQLFFSGNKLTCRYQHNDQSLEKQFNGYFTSRGYYEIYFRKEKREIPPVIPFIYSNNKINRVRLALTNEGDFIVDNAWENFGHILIFGAGESGRRQSFFKTSRLSLIKTHDAASRHPLQQPFQ